MEIKIQETLELISSNEHILDELFAENRSINDELLAVEQEISESNSLLKKYDSLNTQYEADAKRLEFVIEGEIHKGGLDVTMECPFCGGALTKSVEESCVEAAKKEFIKLAPKIKDLTETIQEVKARLEVLENNQRTLRTRKKAILDKINKEIKPLIDNLKNQLQQYKDAIEDSKEASMILQQEDIYNLKLQSIKKQYNKEFEPFDVMSKYQTINEYLCNEYKRLLQMANYAHYDDVVIDKFDYTINGKLKRTQGQGYRAYLNSLAALALYNCLNDNGVFKFPFLVIDSDSVKNVV